MAKKPTEFRRLLVTGGSCAGLAAAFNAPLTGICFAFEETHKRISPYIIAAALSAVSLAVVTSQAVLFGFGHIPYFAAIGVGAGKHALAFLAQTAPSSVGEYFGITAAAAACGVACAGLGVAFAHATKGFSKLLGRIKRPFLRLLPAYLSAAALGLAFFLSAGSGDEMLCRLAEAPELWLLVGLLAARLFTTTLASGSGATGGLFMPMIAIGAVFGYIAARACVLCGLPAALAPNIVVICISAFFAAVVRAPITSIILSVELTASFVSLLPCVIAVAASTAIADLTRTEPLYERILDGLLKGGKLTSRSESLTVRGVLPPDSPIAQKRVRDILWPYNSLVTELRRDGELLVPDGETVLHEGDGLTIRAENVDIAYFYLLCGEFMDCEDIPDLAAAPARTDSDIVLTARNLD